MNRNRFPILFVAAALSLLSGCATDSVLEYQFAAPPAASEELSVLSEMPAGLRVLPGGRWALEATGGDASSKAAGNSSGIPYRVESTTLLVPIQGGAFDARVLGVLRPEGVPQVAASAAGVVVAGVGRGQLHPGAGVIAVRVGDGLTRMAGSWRMPAALGRLEVERLELSPDGRRVACQIIEMQTQKKGGLRQRSRRGVVLALFEDQPAVDLGPGVDGPFRWSPDGESLYFVRVDGKAMTLRRVALPSLGPAPPPPVQARNQGVVPPGVDTGNEGSEPGNATPTPSGDIDQEKLIAQIIVLSGDDPAARLAAARSLAMMPHPMAVGPLISAMEEGDVELCRTADGSLRTLFGGAGLDDLAAAGADVCIDRAGDWRDWWTQNSDALGGG